MRERTMVDGLIIVDILCAVIKVGIGELPLSNDLNQVKPLVPSWAQQPCTHL